MAEGQIAHRHKLEEKAIDAQIRFADSETEGRKRGQWLAFGVCLAAIVGGSIVGGLGHEWAGSIIGGGGLAGIVTAFVWGRREAREAERKGTEPDDARPVDTGA